jgi:hypothetical protein
LAQHIFSLYSSIEQRENEGKKYGIGEAASLFMKRCSKR